LLLKKVCVKYSNIKIYSILILTTFLVLPAEKLFLPSLSGPIPPAFQSSSTDGRAQPPQPGFSCLMLLEPNIIYHGNKQMEARPNICLNQKSSSNRRAVSH